MMSLHSKKIVITGASPDLGVTLAECFADVGAVLFLTARTQKKAEFAANAARRINPHIEIHAFELDVEDVESIAAFLEQLGDHTDYIDILINNASHWLSQDDDPTDERISKVMKSTLLGTVATTKALLGYLRKSKSPDVVTISGLPGPSYSKASKANDAFSAAKGGQSVFVDRIRSSCKLYGIRTTAVYPPRFVNVKSISEPQWYARDAKSMYMSSRNVVACIMFALSRERIQSIDSIVLSNTIELS